MTRDNQTPSQRRESIVAEPYAWPGGYPKYAVLADGEALCAKCCETEAEHIDAADIGDDWRIEAIDINWEDENLHCCHCNNLIECAYPST